MRWAAVLGRVHAKFLGSKIQGNGRRPLRQLSEAITQLWDQIRKRSLKDGHGVGPCSTRSSERATSWDDFSS